MADPGTIAVFIPIVALCIPITAIISKHFKDLAEIKARQGTTLAPQVQEELSKLRQEVATLRDTTTKFDMSFDAAIDRLESRVDRLEEQNVTTGPLREPIPRPTVATTRVDEAPAVVQIQGR